MLAYRYHADKTLALENAPVPTLEEGGALVRVTACAICGTDVRTYRFGSGKIDAGRTVGHELVGVIQEISPELGGQFQVGDRIGMAPAIGCGECPSCRQGRTNMCDHLSTMGFQYDGGFAEYVAIPRQAFRMGNVYRLPQAGNLSAYTLSEPLACVINAQSYLSIRSGEDVVVFGAGAIGCMHAQLALDQGARQVFLVETAQERIDQARPLLEGVRFIDASRKDPVEEVFARTNGKGAEVAIIACSVGPAQSQGLGLLAKCGRISLFGGLPGEAAGFLDSNLIHYRELCVFGVHASTPDQNRQAARMIQEGRLDPEAYISRRYPLGQIPQAFEDIASGAVLKAVVLCSDTE